LAFITVQLGPFVDTGLCRSWSCIEAAHPNIVIWYDLGIGITTEGLWAQVLLGFAFLNIVLAIFNMLPIPPLDGSKLLPLVLPEKGKRVFYQVSQYGFLILFALVFVVFRGRLGFLSDAVGWLMRGFV